MSDKLFETEETPPVDENKNYLEDLVGEGKKYKDVEALAKAIVFKDQHISHLETENETFRGELKVRTTLEEFLDQMKTSQEPNQETKPDEQPAPMTKQDLEAFLESKLKERETRSKTESNIQKVRNVLEGKWGSSWQAELRRKSKELSVGEDFLTSLASEQPDAFLKLVDVQEKSNDVSLTSRVSAPPVTSNVKNNKFYRKMLLENPKQYWKPETQVEMFQQAKALGDDFYA